MPIRIHVQHYKYQDSKSQDISFNGWIEYFIKWAMRPCPTSHLYLDQPFFSLSLSLSLCPHTLCLSGSKTKKNRYTIFSSCLQIFNYDVLNLFLSSSSYRSSYKEPWYSVNFIKKKKLFWTSFFPPIMVDHVTHHD